MLSSLRAAGEARGRAYHSVIALSDVRRSQRRPGPSCGPLGHLLSGLAIALAWRGQIPTAKDHQGRGITSQAHHEKQAMVDQRSRQRLA